MVKEEEKMKVQEQEKFDHAASIEDVEAKIKQLLRVPD